MRLVRRKLDLGIIISGRNAFSQRNSNSEIDFTQPLLAVRRRRARIGDSNIKHKELQAASNIAQKYIEPRSKNARLNSVPIN
jgi:hypothetical protein